MAIKITCDCGKKLIAKDELAGSRVKCPACQTPLTVPMPEVEEEPLDDEQNFSSTPENEYDEEEAGVPSNSGSSVNSSTTSESDSRQDSLSGLLLLGISLVYYGLVLSVLTIILLFLSTFIPLNLMLITLVIKGSGVMGLIAEVMSVIGTGLCLAAPNKMPGKKVIYITIGCMVVAFLIDVVGQFTAISRIVSGMTTIISNVVGYVSFLVFLKQLALWIQKPLLADIASGLIKLVVVEYILLILLMFGSVIIFIMPLGWLILGFFVVAAVVVGAIGFIRYAVLLRNLKTANMIVEGSLSS